MLQKIAVSGYRSLRDFRVALGQVTVVTGANGSGKSSLYRALRLLSDVGQGRIIGSLAAEGGLRSTLWAGPATFAASVKRGEHAVEGLVRSGPVSLKLGFSGDDYGYAIDLGMPIPSSPASQFDLDPAIKAECLWTGETLGSSNVFAARAGGGVRIRDASGQWRQAMHSLAAFDSMLTHAGDPRDGLELLLTRERLRQWRFYDHLRTDREAPSRRAQVGTYTPVLDSDGRDLAAALQTIREIGDERALDEAVADAFPNSRVDIHNVEGWFHVTMKQHGLLRALGAAELSDGTLRYLMLVAALLTPRPPELMVLNEPETSLHPDLLAPLARLVTRASKASQIILVTHAQALVAQLSKAGSAKMLRLEKTLSETLAPEEEHVAWNWPKR